jgi:anti-sigma B factor antagonist
MTMNSNLNLESWIIDGDILAIMLRGNLDSASTPEFESVVNKHLEGGHSKIIIDCRYLGYLSSMAIGSLVALQTRLRRRGGAVKLAALQGPAMQVIRAVRLDKLLDLYGDLEFARQSFENESPSPDEESPREKA